MAETRRENLAAKKDEPRMRITGFLNGENKIKFVDDCQHRYFGEAKMIKHIVSVYYSIPGIEGLNMIEAKKIISEKFRL